jgi:hypothetical protein
VLPGLGRILFGYLPEGDVLMIARRPMLLGSVSLLALIGLLMIMGAPALAAGSTIKEESVSDVGSTSAKVSARINPQGVVSFYHVEYGINSFSESSTPEVGVGNGQGETGVLVQLSDLQAEKTYRLRLVATNSGKETTYGDELVFTTLAAGSSSSLALPDDRGYEIVSSVGDINGNVYEPPGENGIQANGITTRFPMEAAGDGSAVAYVGDPPPSGGNGRTGLKTGNQYLARRTPAGWATVDIQPQSPGNTYPTTSYTAFSRDLAFGILESREQLTEGAPGGKYQALYSDAFESGTIHPVFTQTPTTEEFRAAGVPESEGALFAGGNTGTVSVAGFSHLLFEANDALTEDAEEHPPTVEQNDLYDSADGHVSVVNVLPSGALGVNATFGTSVSEPNYNWPNFSHVISADGSRIIWTTLEPVKNEEGRLLEEQPKALYMRENDTEPESPVVGKGHCTVPTDACTVELDATQGPGSSGGGRFWTASSDGSKVFFTDESQLTAGSTSALGKPDLYEYDVEDGALIDLTVAAPGKHADVQGVVAVSENGEYVYFVANGALAPGATTPAQPCSKEEVLSEAKCNLYVIQKGESMKFIGVLGANDNRVSPYTLNSHASGDWQPGLSERMAETTPDGRHLVFMSEEDLTAYRSNKHFEVYIYDAEAESLRCTSCDPGGASPATEAHSAAAFVRAGEGHPTLTLRWISEDGNKVFFDSNQALVPQDTNGQLDVYEWAREGTGGCLEDSPMRQAGGCIYLLSGGTSADGSFFLDASASGGDVFVVTRAQLLAQDQDENFDLYDARIGAVQSLSPPACSGVGCQGVPPAPPIFATPSSVTFTGVGNFASPSSGRAVRRRAKAKKCTKSYVKKHGRCVRRKHKRTRISSKGGR